MEGGVAAGEAGGRVTVPLRQVSAYQSPPSTATGSAASAASGLSRQFRIPYAPSRLRELRPSQEITSGHSGQRIIIQSVASDQKSSSNHQLVAPKETEINVSLFARRRSCLTRETTPILVFLASMLCVQSFHSTRKVIPRKVLSRRMMRYSSFAIHQGGRSYL